MNMKQSILAIFLLTLATFGCRELAADEIRCEGEYTYHLQGFASDGEHIFWSFTNVLVQTDLTGKVLRQLDVPSHHGDCCVVDGKLYVSTHLRWPRADAESWIYVYDCADLTLVNRFRLEEFDKAGVDAIAFRDGSFYVGLGKDKEDTTPFNRVVRFTPEFTVVETYEIPSETVYGFQASCYADGWFWFGAYGRKATTTLQCDPANMAVVANQPLDMSVGVFGLPSSASGETRLLIARHQKNPDTQKCLATARTAVLRDGKLTWE